MTDPKIARPTNAEIATMLIRFAAACNEQGLFFLNPGLAGPHDAQAPAGLIQMAGYSLRSRADYMERTFLPAAELERMGGEDGPRTGDSR